MEALAIMSIAFYSGFLLITRPEMRQRHCPVKWQVWMESTQKNKFRMRIRPPIQYVLLQRFPHIRQFQVDDVTATQAIPCTQEDDRIIPLPHNRRAVNLCNCPLYFVLCKRRKILFFRMTGSDRTNSQGISRPFSDLRNWCNFFKKSCKLVSKY